MFLSAYVVCSFRLLKLKSEGQTMYTENLQKKSYKTEIKMHAKQIYYRNNPTPSAPSTSVSALGRVVHYRVLIVFSIIPTRPATTTCQKSETFGYKT